jgi:hypothetical protein
MKIIGTSEFNVVTPHYLEINVAAQRLSSRGGAISIKHRRISHDAKHAPAARVQRSVMPRR